MLLLASCAQPDPREAAIVDAMVRADGPLIRSRPALVAGKYARMARRDDVGGEGLFDYYRGSVPVFRGDLTDGRLPIAHTDFPADGPLPVSMGDAHPENFGVLVAADGTAAFEPNDLDAGDRLPYYWDLRRLTVGLLLATRQSNADDAAARATVIAAEADVVRVCASAYQSEMHAIAGGTPTARMIDGGGSAVIEDLFRRSRAGRTTTLASLTTLGANGRRLVRGVLDPTQPEQVFVELSDEARAALPDVLTQARAQMTAPPDEAFFTVIDAVRELGSGVASWPRVRAIVLVRGPSDDPGDDALLELKELGDSGAPAVYPPFRPTDDIVERMVLARSRVWSRVDADPFWVAVPTWLGMPTQVRTETDAHPTLRAHRLHGALGTPTALRDLAHVLGTRLARAMARGVDDGIGPAIAIDRALSRDPSAFAEGEVVAALDEADRIERDFEHFRDALDHLGLQLGVHRDPRDRPRPEIEALFGVPPIVPVPQAYR